MDWYFQAKENFRMITIRSFVVKLLAFASLFVFVRERSDVVPYILISTFSVVTTQIWNLSYAYKTGLRISLRNLEIRKHIKPMFVFLWSNVAVSVFAMIDVVMLGFLSSYEQVGYYTSPGAVVDMILGGCIAINTALLPRLSYSYAQRNDTANAELLQKAFDLNALLIAPMAIGLFLIASHFIPFFLGLEFMGSIVPMQILAFKVPFWVFNNFFVLNALFVFGQEKKFLLVVTCTALLSFVLNLFFIPHYGAIGAAIVAVIIGGGFQIGFNLYFVYKCTKVRVRWIAMRTAILCTLPFFALYYICERFISHNVIFLGVFISLSAMMYFMLQIVAKNSLVHQIIENGKNRLRR
jgi:O-antigen/teichoic acid export membrane protein